MVPSFWTFLSLGFLVSVPGTCARAWRDSGTGTVVLEEAWTIPEFAAEMKYVVLYTVVKCSMLTWVNN